MTDHTPDGPLPSSDDPAAPRRSFQNAILLAVICALGPVLEGQILLQDLRPGPPDTNNTADVAHLHAVGSLAFFLAGDDSAIWRTDGTPQGTFPVRSHSKVSRDPYLVPVGNRVIWPDTETRTVWASDGTVQGTRPISPSPCTIDPGVVISGTHAYWSNYFDGAIWESDGTPAGTRAVTPRGVTGQLLATNGLAFVMRGQTFHLLQPTGSTHLPIPNNSGTEIRKIDPDLEVLGNAAYFLASSSQGVGLYRIGGMPLAVTLVRSNPDIGFVPGQHNVRRTALTRLGNRLFFTGASTASGVELWSSDGTTAGTVQVADIAPGSGSSAPDHLTACNGRLFFSANDGVSGRELWITDGTTAGTRMVRDILGGGGSSPKHLTALGNTLLFSATDWITGEELWRSDGTAAGTVQVADIRPGLGGSHPGRAMVGNPSWALPNITPFGGRVLFTAHDGTVGPELWWTDGTTAGTTLVTDAHSRPIGSEMTPPLRSGDHAWFVTRTTAGATLWSTDGRTAFASHTSTPYGSRTLARLPEGGIALHLHGTGPAQMWVASPGQKATLLLPNLPKGTTILGSLPGGVLCGHPAGLLATDGTVGGTSLISTVPFDWLSRAYAESTRIWVFRGAEVWVSDGSSAGTRRVAAHPQPATRPIGPGAGVFYYAAGTSFWKTDGQTSVPAPELVAAGVPTNRGETRVIGNQTYLFVDEQLWITDGTVQGTTQLASFPGGLCERQHVGAGRRLYFFADDGVRGMELWTSMGTSVSTRLVKDVNPHGGQDVDRWSTVPLLVSLGASEKVLFPADDVLTGRELWISDGTAAGTTLLADLHPGVLSSNPGVGDMFSGFGKKVLFSARHPVFGTEPFVIDLADLDVPVLEPLGAGCPGSGNLTPEIGGRGLPTLGNTTFAITLGRGRASSAYALALGLARSPLRIAGCTLEISQPLIVLTGSTNVSGAAAVPAAIPNSPSLLNAEVVGQFAVADPAGSWFGAMSLSPGLRVVVGR